MAAHTENERFLRDGALVIYQRTDVAKSNWHCRIKFQNQPYIRRSLQCSSEADALRIANKLYDDLKFKYERGLALTSQPFPRAAKEQFNWLEDQINSENDEGKSNRLKRKLADHRNTATYAIEYFANMNIDKITDLDIERYKEWRKTYWTRGSGADKKTIEYVRNGKKIRAPRPKIGIPALSTMAREDVVLRAIFDRARKLGWVTSDQIPEIKSEKSASNRRPDFTEQELQHLLNVAIDRIESASNDHIHFQRTMVFHFIGLMAFSGMRPFEAMKLQWQDIDMFDTKSGKPATKIFVSGKNKKRTLVTRDDASGYVFGIADHLNQLRASPSDDAVETLYGYVFSMPDQTPIKSFKKGLGALLEAAGLRKDSNGQLRDAYSFRHYYATQRLLKGVNVYTLADNMGTSVGMIEKHYGHLKPEMAADELTQE